MNDEPSHKELIHSFKELTGSPPTSITPLKPHASERSIFRISSATESFIGVINPSTAENECFIKFAEFFKQQALPVPEIYLYKPECNLYVEEDLGDETLYDYLLKAREQSDNTVPESAYAMYQAVLEILPRFQIECAKQFDFSTCYPEQHLLPGTFAGDCANFATELVARMLPTYDTSMLTKDFAALIAFMGDAASGFFVYRDFQSRNIMIKNGKPYFIDFQSGRQGALQYDVVSLLYQASTKLPEDVRKALADHYCRSANQYTRLDDGTFYRYYSAFIVCRMLQVLGVYGKQGLGAGKKYFSNSIPLAVNTLAHELSSPDFPVKTPHLVHCVTTLQELIDNN